MYFSCAQPEIFQSRGGFVELEHFDKLFLKSTRKEDPQRKILELFLLDTLKTTFSMKNLTQEWTQLGPFFTKSGLFFYFQIRQRVLPSPFPTPSCAPVFIGQHTNHCIQKIKFLQKL